MIRTAFALTILAGSLAGLLGPNSARAADPTYAVDRIDAFVAVGEKGTASVSITARGGWHLNAEAPLTLKLIPPPGVSVDKPKLGRADLALSNETSARFDVGVVASEPGKKAIGAEAAFVLCREDACRPIKEKLTLSVEAAAPGKTAPAPQPAKKR